MKQYLFIADSFQELNPKKDTTLFMMRESIKNNVEVFHACIEDILFKDGEVLSRASFVSDVNSLKLDAAKKALRIPLRCPKCGGSMKHHLAKKMYKIHGFCFDPCTVEYEASLRKAGLYEQYEKRMMQGNIQGHIEDIENWILESLNDDNSYVTEEGDVEDWGGLSKDYRERIIKELKEYKEALLKHLT